MSPPHALEEPWDMTYEPRGNKELPAICCSKCNPGLIPHFRPLPVKDTGSAFADIMAGKLREWRARTAASLVPPGFPVVESVVLVDSVLEKLAAIDPRQLIADADILPRKLKGWRYSEPFGEQLFQLCQDVARCGPEETASYIHAAKMIRAAKKTKTKASADSTVPSVDDIAAERLDRKHRWLISVGRQDLVPKPKAQGSKRARPSARLGIVTPQPSQTTPQVTGGLSQGTSSQGAIEDIDPRYLEEAAFAPYPDIHTPPRTTTPQPSSIPARENNVLHRPPLTEVDTNIPHTRGVSKS